MDFVKREDQAIIDDELQQHYKLYMENAQKTHHMETGDYQHALSMEQLHQIQTSINTTIAHNFQLPLSPRQISTLMLKTNHFNQIPAHLPRNLEVDLVQNLNDLTQMRNEDIINQNLRLNELELQAAQNLQLNEQELSRLNQDLRLELPQNLGRGIELGHDLMAHMDDRQMEGIMETRMVLEEPRQVDHQHQIPLPFHIKLEQDEEYFYENVNQVNQAINVNGMGHIPVHTEHQQTIHQDQMYVYNNHVGVPALNSLDLYPRPQNYVQSYVNNVRDNPENLVVHRQFENASPYAEEFKKLREDATKDEKIEQPKENQKPDTNKILFSNYQNDFVAKNENDSSAQNKITEELSMNIKGEYSCYKCNDVFSTKRGLKQHAKTCTEANDPMEKLGKFVCSQCPYRCQSPAILKIHERTHTGEKPFSCTFCDYKSGQKNNVAKHILVHMKEKPFRCQYCEYRCAQKNNLVVHERTHTGYKPFACPYCDYRTVQKPNLVKHMYLHTDQKPFSCDQCTYRCVQKTNLTKHKQRHLNEKGEKVDLKSQTKPYRPRQKSVKCPQCPYKCVQKSSLDKHIEFKHGAVQDLNVEPQASESEEIQNLSVKKDFECQEKMQVS
ncbi:zinc finger protein 84-like isoform X2 [Cydia splendana]|uniref:zinc finger protein 84-like isoform X2 n=1 Tax=Cydia splendana TaxID=1100963 RepID=UPI0028F48FD3